VLELLRANLVRLGLQLRTLECGTGRARSSLTFEVGVGLARPTRWCCSQRGEADLRRNGYHASFMCRPRLPT